MGQEPTEQENRQELNDLAERQELCEPKATAVFEFDEIELVLDQAAGLAWSMRGGQQGVEDSEIVREQVWHYIVERATRTHDGDKELLADPSIRAAYLGM